MKILNLTNSELKCQIDDEDSIIGGLSWHLKKSGFGEYVCASRREGNTVKTIRLHRFLWEIHFGVIPIGEEIHHKDFNTMNNQVSNLECLSKSEHKRIHIKELKSV